MGGEGGREGGRGRGREGERWVGGKGYAMFDISSNK